jgi:branched-chain amino acid aminotransferase
MGFFIFNGAENNGLEPAISLQSRVYRYGDGFFESMKYSMQQIQHAELHMLRIQKSAMLLNMSLPATFDFQSLSAQIHEILIKQQQNHANVRCTFLREGEGLYTPENESTQIVVEIKPCDAAGYPLNEAGLRLGIYKELSKNANFTSTLKTTSANTYVMGGMYAKKHGWDDCALVNDSGRIAETVSSNIFTVSGEFINTPPLSEYCVDGVMRKVVLQLATAYGYNTREQPITAISLNAADEIFTTNAVKGIQWIGEFEGKSYKNATAKVLSGMLNKPFAVVG